MAVDSAWDVKIVNATTLATVAFVPSYIAVQVTDVINDVGGGSLEMDFDDPMLADFYTNNGSKYPWEGNFAVQVVRNGTAIATFLIENSDVQYSGDQRLVVMQGRGLAACLEWAVVLPENWDEGNTSDPDANVVNVSRGFGKTHETTAELDSGAHSIDNPKFKAYGGAAFTFLFKEADNGVNQTWTNYAHGSADRNGDPVDWPLSLSAQLLTGWSGSGSQALAPLTNEDSNGTTWTTTATYPTDEVNYLFEIPSGITYLDALNQLCAVTSNAQWYVNASGVIFISKTLGTDRSTTILLTIPNATSSSRSLRRPDLRTFMFASNGFTIESQKNTSQVSAFGRREGFIGHQHADGQSNADAAKQALDSVKDPLDEYTFQYIETDTTRAWIDFVPGDTVKIEYEAGVTQDRQIVGLGLALTPDEVRTEVVIGDVIDGVLRRIQKKEGTGQYSDQIDLVDFKAGRIPDPPDSITSVTKEGGPFNSGVLVGWNTPAKQENLIEHFEVEVAPTGKRADGSTDYRGKDTSGSDVTYNDDPVRIKTGGTSVMVNGLGRPDGKYKAKVRSVNRDQRKSAWSTESEFNLSSFNVTIVSGHVASSNYNPGSAGWVIKADGSVEFENGTFRGTIDASKAHIGTFNADRIPNLNASKITAGTINASTVTITNLNADNITSGTIDAARIDVNALTITGADIASGTFPGSSYVFKGSGTARVTFNTSTSVSSSIKFGTTSDDDAFGSINYGSGSFGGFSYSGLGMYNNAKDNYIVLQNTGNSPHVRMQSTSNMFFNLEGGGASLNDILDVWGDIRIKHNLVVGSDSAAPGGFGIKAYVNGWAYIVSDITCLGGITSTGSIVPASTASFSAGDWHGADLGSTSKYWDDVYAKSGVTTSDVNLKDDIQNASLGLDFIKGLRPVSFTWKEGATGRDGARKHHGFIAQEVETLLGDDASSTALWIDGAYDKEEHWKHADIESGDPDGKSKVTVEAGNTQGIRYTELIAPIVKAIQEMETRLSALES
tara:strand:+ start:715 stop:3735 length:3021 start_codon:yes stop_codon:yes gene_type:complete